MVMEKGAVTAQRGVCEIWVVWQKANITHTHRGQRHFAHHVFWQLCTLIKL